MTDERKHPDTEELELTEAERESLSRLPRERSPSDLLESRVVRELEARGVLGPGSRARTIGAPAASTGGGSVTRPGASVPLWAAAAAGFVLFLFGGLTGHRLGARGATDALLAVREQDAALRVQEIGSAYVRALAALEAAPEAPRPRSDREREVATSTLHAAASVIARLDPGDPLAPVLVDLLGRGTREDSGDDGVVHRTFSF